MKWYEEIRITRLPLDQIGMAFVVRDVFGNDCRMDLLDADSAFGHGWLEKANSLKRAGVMRLSIHDRIVEMKVVAPGDTKRRIMKNYMRKIRNIQKGKSK